MFIPIWTVIWNIWKPVAPPTHLWNILFENSKRTPTQNTFLFFLIWRKNKDPTYVFYNIKQGSSSVLISFPYLIIRLFIHGIYYSNIFNNWSATLYYWTMEKGSIIYLLMTLLPYEFEGLTFLYLVFSIRLVNIRLVITNIIHKDIVNERKRQINTIT